MSDIVLLDHQGKRPTKAQQADQIMADVREVAKVTAARICVEATGPMAQILAELMDRQAALEDHVGFTYVPKAKPEASVSVPPIESTVVAEGGDSE